MSNSNSPSSIEPSRVKSRYVEPCYLEPKGRVFALQIVVAQAVVSAVLSLLGLVFSSQVAMAILSGGVICAFANLWFAIVAFRPALGKPPGELLAAFYVAEIGKFVVTALLFLLVFTRFLLFREAIYALLIFIAYALVQTMVWVYPLARSKFLNYKSAR